MNKKLLAAAISGALVAPTAAQAIEYAISGHVNRMIRFADDGKASDIQFLDNSASRTRIRFRGSGDIGRGMKAGIYIETSAASNASSAVPLKSGDTGDIAFDIRHSVLDFSGKWGKVSLGHTSDAADGIAFADQSGTFLVDEVSSTELASAIVFRTGGGGTVAPAAGSGLCGATGASSQVVTAAGVATLITTPGSAGSCTVGGSRNSFDGGRRDVLRYDSPSIGPATIAVSAGNDSRFDFGVYIDTNLGGGSLSLYGGYSKPNTNDQWALSASYLFSQGTNISLTYGERDVSGGSDPTNFYVKLGHKWGNNAVSISWGETQDLITSGADGEMWGLGWQHNIPKPGVQLYAGFKQYQLNTNGTARTALGMPGGAKDVNVFVVGSRVQFN